MVMNARTTREGEQFESALRVLANLDEHQARALPGHFYTSERLLALEEAVLFRNGWVCLGRADEIVEPGDFFTTELSGEPLLVVRDSGRKLRVLSNVCRHRGMILAEGAGNAAVFTCPYHAWSYRADGTLIGAPLMRNTPGFDRKDCSLPEFASEVWQGFIFVNLDRNAPPLHPQLAGLLPEIENYHLDDMRHAFSEEVVWNTNWKSLVENFMEGYHLSVVHSTSLKHITPTDLCKHFTAGEAYMGYRAWYPDTCPERGNCHPDLSAEQRRYSVMFCVYPAMVIGLVGAQVLYMCLRPNGTDSVIARWGLAVYGDVEADELAARLDLYRKVNAEDKAQLEKLARGQKSAHYVPGLLAPADYEGTIRDFQNYLASRLVPEVKTDKDRPVAVV
jgi:phenylpropionate dioxygenase-like ring-hydroxylating dioxygenase large terminal subunit